jgi:hypothetical protein
VLARLEIGHGLRLPLTSLSPAYSQRLDTVVDRLQQLEQSCRDIAAA